MRRGLVVLLLASTALTGCTDPEPPKPQNRAEEVLGAANTPQPTTPAANTPAPPVFDTVEACAEAGTPRAECETLQREAQAEHERTAPRSPTQKACEDQYGTGECRVITRTENGRTETSYIPALAGFVVGIAGAMAAAHVIHSLTPSTTTYRQPRAVPVYRQPLDTGTRCRQLPRPSDCPIAGSGSRGYSYGGAYNTTTTMWPPTRPAPSTTTVRAPVAPPAASTFVTRPTPADPAAPPFRQTAPVTRAPSPVAPPVVSKPAWSAPRVTETPATASKPAGGFGSAASTRSTYSAPRASGGFSARGGGGGS